MKKSHLNISVIVCYIKTCIKDPMLLYQSNDSRGNTVTRAMSFEKVWEKGGLVPRRTNQLYFSRTGGFLKYIQQA